MLQFQDTYTPEAVRNQDWSTEITPPQSRPAMRGVNPGASQQPRTGMMTGTAAQPPKLEDMGNDLPVEVITSPTSVQEAYRGSWKAVLSRYVGSYVVATFLVGTQNTVSWEGVLFDVGNDYITIYQEARDRYIVSDYYSLKFIEFYDVERRRRCAELLREDGWDSGMGGGMGGMNGMSGMAGR